MRYDRNDGEWTQRILEEDGKITRVTGVNTEYQGRVGYRCDPTREKVLIDLALLIRSFEKTRENVRSFSLSLLDSPLNSLSDLYCRSLVVTESMHSGKVHLAVGFAGRALQKPSRAALEN